eukprot:CAMPEP_0197488208 /NCGR_PEP_ID=MMETSP1311-20131121/3186_1 /TAXON_ID=464262 /ORGANISM="Genus nov. species nov., Strain RCC856" /LENGTH=1764 /DNA_ID=CAMNT_0043032175 /DNA_START=186 /DNA_END=5480 /DNA_ORIENTATION=+
MAAALSLSLALALLLGASAPSARAQREDSEHGATPELSLPGGLTPVAFFPLTGKDELESHPDGKYGGKIVGGDVGVTFDASDALFPNAMTCLDHAAGLVELDNVPYGTKGDFSINLWIKNKPRKLPIDLDGDEEDDDDLLEDLPQFEYIFSHSTKEVEAGSFNPFTPSQIHLYLPTVATPAHGVVRAIVKDSTDEYVNTNSQTFLDSDGRFMDNYARNIPGHVDLENDEWHMVTLTSEGGGKKGYRMYVDGVLAGEAPPSVILRQLESGLTDIPGVYVDGGDPLGLTGKIHLCGRVDKDSDRHFGGALSHLSLWDAVLSNGEVAALYSGVVGEAKLRQRCADAAASELQAIDGIDLCPFFAASGPPGAGSLATGAQPQQPASSTTLNDVLRDLRPAENRGEMSPPRQEILPPAPPTTLPPPPPPQQPSLRSDLTSGVFCDVLQVPSSCGLDAICVPLKTLADISGEMLNLGPGGATKGKCVAAPVGGIFPPDARVDVPLPLAFYPLTGGSVESWPLDTYKGKAVGVEWVPDVLFENTLKCSEQQGGYVQLPNIKYGEKGQFAVNFWMKKDVTDLNDPNEGLFEYIFSHGQATDGNFNPFGPNQVHVYMPEVAHPAHGVARVILKDSLSPYKGLMSHTFFDSDGKFMDNNPRNTIGHVNLEDGNWHMFTVTTKATGEPGYQIFVDGALGGSFPTPEVQNFLEGQQGGSASNPVDFHVDGGSPMNMEGDIFLCGRADLAAERHFDGQLAHLSIYDQSLSPEMIGAIFTAVKGKSLLMESITDLAASIRALQPNGTEGGRPRYVQTLQSADIIRALQQQQQQQQQLQPQGPSAEAEELNALISQLQNGEAISCSIDVQRSGYITPLGCEKEGMVCAALHEDSLKSQAASNGVCVATPEGGIYTPLPSMNLPVPKAYFPLTGGSLESWPEPKYSGRVQESVQWVEDEFFGSVLECKENSLDYVRLDNIDYGRDGPFAINLWMSHNGSSGDTFEYLFSHGTANIGKDPWQPNEVQIFLPEIAHPAHGVVRTIVKDSNDLYDGEMSHTYLDSDGGFMNNMPRNVPGHVPLDDGKWHMVTVTTRDDGKRGFAVYVDGILGGTSPPAFMEQLQSKIAVDGGDPMIPTGDIFLCGRNDLAEERHFGGKIAHLSLYDEALSAKQIMALYVAAAGEAAALQRTMGLIINQIPQQASTATRETNDLLKTLNRAQVGEACYLLQAGDMLQEQLYAESLDNKFCVDGAICAPKANSPTMIEDDGSASISDLQYANALHGQCVEVPTSDVIPELESHDGAMFFPNPLMNVPVPVAFFPLTAGKMSSWPSDLYSGANVGAKWVDDSLFGQVLSCDGVNNAYLALDSVPYAENGNFAVNFWFRNKDMQGTSFEYVYSHSGDDDMSFNPFYPNQVHIYLPEVSHPAHGVIRTIVKDGDDVFEGAPSETFLDSDGYLNFNEARDAPGHIDVSDDEWHMITLTTRQDGGDGYAIFVDGVLGGANFLPTDGDSQASLGRPPSRSQHLDGGSPAALNGHIFLCGRNDLHPERHFKGKLSHLSLYDTSLSPASIAALFVSVKGEDAYLQRMKELVAAQDPRLVSSIDGPSGGTPEDAAQRLQDSLDAVKTGTPEENAQKLQDSLDAVKEGRGSNANKDYLARIREQLKAAYEKGKEATSTKMGAGIAIGIAITVAVLGIVGIGFCVYSRRQKNRDKGIQLPTVSRTPSRNISNQCISPDGSARAPDSAISSAGTANPLAAVEERVKTAQIKREHKKAAEYATMEDEE